MSSEAPELVHVFVYEDGDMHAYLEPLRSINGDERTKAYRLASSVEREIAERDAEIKRLRNALKLLGEGSTARMVTKGRLEVWELMAQYAREVLEGK